MECVQGALKSSFMPEILLKTTTITHHHHSLQHPVSVDDLHVPADDFSVDDLLDFNGDGFEDPTHEDDTKPPPISPTPPPPTTNFSAKDLPLSFPLCETADDEMAELEWVSQYVDDTSGYSLTAKIPENLKHSPAAAAAVAVPTPPVQTKARSKRTRTGGRVWSLGSTPLTESSATSSSSSSSYTSNPCLVFGDSSQTAESLSGKPPAAVGRKPRRKKPAGDAGGQQQPRRCSHCLVQKTPQWRTGPLGAKTLCNACGVRYKSGRLLPEYRPACSPTFSSEVHSNNHRKVLEMRRKKEAVGGCVLPVQRY